MTTSPDLSAKEIEDAVYDLKAVNPHKRQLVDDRTPEDLNKRRNRSNYDHKSPISNLQFPLPHRVPP